MRFAVDKSLSISSQPGSRQKHDKQREDFIQQVKQTTRTTAGPQDGVSPPLQQKTPTTGLTTYIIEADQFKENTDTIKIHIYVHEGQGKV